MENGARKYTLVTGPDGFVGAGVCRELLKRNHFVRGAQWKAGCLQVGCESIVVGNIDATTDWRAALRNVDSVVHLAARVHVMNDTAADSLSAFRKVNLEGTKRLAECAAVAGVQQFLFVSSIKVNGESTTDKPFSEEDIPKPEDPYARSKLEAEQHLREIEAETGMSVTILRPPLLYGPGVKANFLKLIRLIDKGVPLPLGSIENKRSLLGVRNFASLICLCIEHNEAWGETFVVSDGCALSTADLARKISAALDKKPHIIPVSLTVLRMLGFVSGKQAAIKRLTESLVVDSTKVRRILSWKPSYTMEAELLRTAKWYHDSNKGRD